MSMTTALMEAWMPDWWWDAQFLRLYFYLRPSETPTLH